MHRLVRPLAAANIPAIAALRHATFFFDGKRSLDADAAGLLDILHGDGYEAAFVAEVDGQAVGTCLFVRDEIGALHEVGPWLAGLVVTAPFRGLGLGRLLVEAVERHAATIGGDVLYLYTDDAEPFYLALGWQVAERLMAEGEPLVLMSKPVA